MSPQVLKSFMDKARTPYPRPRMTTPPTSARSAPPVAVTKDAIQRRFVKLLSDAADRLDAQRAARERATNRKIVVTTSSLKEEHALREAERFPW
jgi:hypothetical protein